MCYSTSMEQTWFTFYLTCFLYNSIITLLFWFLSQESLPYPWLVLGWLFVCQHECVYCRDSGRWASSSIPPLPVPWWQALIKWTSALPCTISVTVQPPNKTHTHTPCLACRHNPHNKAENRLKASVVGISNCIHKCHKIKCVVLSAVLSQTHCIVRLCLKCPVDVLFGNLITNLHWDVYSVSLSGWAQMDKSFFLLLYDR